MHSGTVSLTSPVTYHASDVIESRGRCRQNPVLVSIRVGQNRKWEFFFPFFPSQTLIRYSMRFLRRIYLSITHFRCGEPDTFGGGRSSRKGRLNPSLIGCAKDACEDQSSPFGTRNTISGGILRQLVFHFWCCPVGRFHSLRS